MLNSKNRRQSITQLLGYRGRIGPRELAVESPPDRLRELEQQSECRRRKRRGRGAEDAVIAVDLAHHAVPQPI